MNCAIVDYLQLVQSHIDSEWGGGTSQTLVYTHMDKKIHKKGSSFQMSKECVTHQKLPMPN